MSIRIMAQVWDFGPDDRAELVVMLALADFANDDGECWPSMESIGKKSRMSDRNARRILRKLELDGYVETAEGRGRHGGNKYVIRADKMSGRTKCPGGQNVQENRTKRAGKPDIAVSAEPSGTIIEPSEEPPCIPPSEKPQAKARLPDTWALSEDGWAYARSQGIPEQAITDEARGFHAYWSDRTDREARKSARGWEQCWAGWCRRIAPRYARASGAPQPGRSGQPRSLASIAAQRAADRLI